MDDLMGCFVSSTLIRQSRGV